MSQIRKDIISGEWVIFAENRSKKPYAFKHKANYSEKEDVCCPFCVGNEAMTPPERFRTEKNGKWEMRVFKNMYPAVDNQGFEMDTDSFYEGCSGMGFHEVLVDTPVHEEDFDIFTKNHILRVLNVLKMRFLLLEEMEQIKYVQIFKNNGPMAGASILHSHWQIMGVPVIPMEQKRALEAFERYRYENGSCLMCDMIKHEKTEDKRMVFENQYFIAFIPYAAKFSFETWIVPKRHITSYKDISEEEMKSLAEAVKKVVAAVKGIRSDLCYNICFQDSPKNTKHEEFHWYMRIIPRIGAPAGFEYGTGSYINHMLPEHAAERLRERIMN